MPEKPKIKLYLDSLRLERWPRSLAIIPGFLAAFVLNPDLLQTIPSPRALLHLLLAFLLTWLISTANYIVNEITDAPFDRFHPQKKTRPLIENKIDVSRLILLWLVLVAASVAAALSVFEPPFLYSLLALLAAGMIYNVPPVRLKDIPFMDSTVESANNPIRLLIGWFVVASGMPPLTLLIAWWAFGNFLMVGKRVAEKKFLTQEESAGYRRSLVRYTAPMLITFMGFNGLVFLITFAIFAVQSGLHTLLYSLPFVVIYLWMFVKKSLKDREGAEEPEKLLRNPHFALYTLFLAIIFVVAFVCR